MAQALAASFNCPTEFALSVLGGKWKTIILAYLGERPCRYGELRRLLPKLSDKVLSERLRDLERARLVERRRDPQGRGAGLYALTPRGDSLRGVLRDLYAWGDAHAAAFGVSVGNPLQRLDGGDCPVVPAVNAPAGK